LEKVKPDDIKLRGNVRVVVINMYNRGDYWYFDQFQVDTSKWSVSDLPRRNGLYYIVQEESTEPEFKFIILVKRYDKRLEWTVTREFLADNFSYIKLGKLLYA
jgi:hypothetical protein